MRGEEKHSILFLSASSSIFDAIPEELFRKWNFYLVKSSSEQVTLTRLDRPDVVVVDTYGLGVDFLDKVKSNPSIHDCPVLVIDEYDQAILIDKILERGATAYLNIDNFTDDLENKINKLIPKASSSFLLL